MKIDKTDLVSFLGQAERLMLDNGFQRTVVNDNTKYEWKKSIPAGTLLIDVCNDYPTPNYCIYARVKGTNGRLSFRGVFPSSVLDEVKAFITSNMFKDESK